MLQELEAFFAQVHAAEGRDVKPHLPPSYPPGVLLGCVDVVDCLSVSCQVEALPGSAIAHSCKGGSNLVAWRQPVILDLFKECSGWHVSAHVDPCVCHHSCASGCVYMSVQAEEMESWEGLPESLRQEVLSPFCFL